MEGKVCDASAWNWISGFAVSLLAGAVLAELTVRGLRALAAISRPRQRLGFTIAHGMIERAAVTGLATYSLSTSVIFATAWMGLKLACNWNRPGYVRAPCDPDAEAHVPRLALSALAGSLVSAGVAIIGALAICGRF